MGGFKKQISPPWGLPAGRQGFRGNKKRAFSKPFF